MSRLKDKYRQEVVPALMERLGYRNIMQGPRRDKRVLNICFFESSQNSKAL